ncbi:MAG: hypothetical protein ACMXYF_04305 [Candidatus Woesearchaeota archaeon]
MYDAPTILKFSLLLVLMVVQHVFMLVNQFIFQSSFFQWLTLFFIYAIFFLIGMEAMRISKNVRNALKVSLYFALFKVFLNLLIPLIIYILTRDHFWFFLEVLITFPFVFVSFLLFSWAGAKLYEHIYLS